MQPYGTLFWPKLKLSRSFYLKNPFNLVTLLKWPDFYGPIGDQINRVPLYVVTVAFSVKLMSDPGANQSIFSLNTTIALQGSTKDTI